MNTILIVDASASDSRIMSRLLTRAGYNPVFVDSIEAGKIVGHGFIKIKSNG